ncbi:MAG: 5-(carboxyamino)imidazole ribonucleotide synthase [Solirubrobacterales bacterium]
MASRLGIVGGGQLGRMLALAAAPLGVECRFVDPSPEAGAQVAAEQILAPYDNIDALIQLAEWADAVTFEFENVPAPALEAIAAHAPLAPSPRSLEVSQDRLLEKRLFESLGFPVAPYRAVDSLEELEAALAEIGAPAILKTRRLGYDGKGQARIASADQAEHAWRQMEGAPAILEGMVAFEREISAIVVRAADGTVVAYPPAENAHRDGILHTSTAPAPGASRELSDLAVEHALAIADDLNHVGALCVELFVTGEQLVINEIAPRVHNSGHWTLNGAGSSQFENHVRAVVGLPLGAAAPVVPTVMVNLVGGLPESAELLTVRGAHLHLYDKEPRPGRKVGHVNVVELSGPAEPLADRAAQIAALADAAWR